MAARQFDDISGHFSMLEALCQRERGLLAGTVWIRIESDEHLAARAIGQLQELCLRQVSSEGTGRVDKTCLPKNGEIEESFNQDYLSGSPDRAPGE